MLYKKVLEDIKSNKIIKEAGGHIGIEVPFPRLSQHIPLIDKGMSIGILAGSGVGKSRFCRYMYIYTPYKFYKKTGYKVKIFYYPLEDNKEKVYRNCICNYLFEECGIIISPEELASKKRPLPDFVLEKIEEAEEYFKEFESIVKFVDGVNTPKGIYEVARQHALKTGTVEIRKVLDEYGKEVEEKYYKSDVHTIILIDNLSNLDADPEDDIKSEREAMIRLAKYYVREKMVNFLNFTVVQVLQMDFASERQQFSHSGMSIISKLEPSLAGIGEAKVISRYMHLILGIFDPSRFELITYPIPSRQDPENCYRIDILGNKFRAIKVLKNNDGEAGRRTGILFNALSEVMEELPATKTPELKDLYVKLLKKDNKPLVDSKNLPIFTQDEPLIEDTPF